MAEVSNGYIAYSHSTDDHGIIKFYTDADCSRQITITNGKSAALTGLLGDDGKVYVKASAAPGYTALGVTFTAQKSIDSKASQSRSFAPPVNVNVTLTAVTGKPGLYSFMMPAFGENVSISAQFNAPSQQEVSYVDENYETQTVSAYIIDETMGTLVPGFYVVPDGLALDHVIGSNGSGDNTVAIIIPDGKTLSLGSAASPLSGPGFSMGCNLSFYGQINATGKLAINAKNQGINVSGSVTVAHLDVDVVSSTSQGIVAGGGSGSIFAGHQTKGNSLTVRSKETGINGTNNPVAIKYYDVDIISEGSSAYGIYASGGTGITITGRTDGINTVKVLSGGFGGIYGGGCPVTIKYCDVDVSYEGSGSYFAGIFASGSNGVNQGVTIEGVATGDKVNTITVRSTGIGIQGGGMPVTISYCNVEVTGITETNNDYNPCGNYGIHAASSPGLTLTGRADGKNTVKVRSIMQSLFAESNLPVNIKYYDVDVFSQNHSGIQASGTYSGGAIYIEGLASGQKVNKVTTRSAAHGIYAESSPVTIKYCDVEVTGTTKTGDNYNVCRGEGIHAGGYNNTGLTITGRTDVGNKVTVRSYSFGLMGGGTTVTISNSDVDVVSENVHGIQATGNGLSLTSTLQNGNTIKLKGKVYGIASYGSSLVIDNCTVDIEAENCNAINGNCVNGATIKDANVTVKSKLTPVFITNAFLTITDSKLTATCTGEGTGAEGDAGAYSGIFVSQGMTVDGSQVTATAEKGYAGIITSFDNHDEVAETLKNITFSWKNATDFIKVDKYMLDEDYALVIAEGKVFKYGDNDTKLLAGPVADVSALEGMTLTPYGYCGYCGEDDPSTDADESKNLVWEIPLNGTVTTIIGSGEMKDYSTTGTPWAVYEPTLILVPDEAAYNAFVPKVSAADKAVMAPIEINVAKNAGGWSTFCHNYPVAYSLSDDATAYTVSGLSADATSVQATATAATAELIAPAVPLLLGYSGEGSVTLTVEPAETATPSTADIVRVAGTGVVFCGALADKTFTQANMAANNYYVLRNNAFVWVKNPGTIAAHRCWLEMTGNAARQLNIVFGEATAVTPTPNPSRAGGEWYDLQGRKMVHGTSSNGTLPKGIYVRNGKKFIVK